MAGGSTTGDGIRGGDGRCSRSGQGVDSVVVAKFIGATGSGGRCEAGADNDAPDAAAENRAVGDGGDRITPEPSKKNVSRTSRWRTVYAPRDRAGDGHGLGFSDTMALIARSSAPGAFS